MFKKILCALGWLNAGIVSFFVWLFFLRPERKKGTFEKVTVRDDFLVIWDVANDSEFYKKSMDGWYGFVAGCHIVVVDYDKQDPSYIEHMRHEGTHGYQNYIFGVLFYPIYVLISGFIWLFLKKLHAYLDNPFERWARRRAGQQVNIPRSEWGWSKNDRWPWW